VQGVLGYFSRLRRTAEVLLPKLGTPLSKEATLTERGKLFIAIISVALLASGILCGFFAGENHWKVEGYQEGWQGGWEEGWTTGQEYYIQVILGRDQKEYAGPLSVTDAIEIIHIARDSHQHFLMHPEHTNNAVGSYELHKHWVRRYDQLEDLIIRLAETGSQPK